MNIHFHKYQGTGNDFIMIDDRSGTFPVSDYKLINRLCDRRFGIGADGLILLHKPSEGDFYMKYYNSDGNESSMCGNGGRCIAAFAHQLKVVNNQTYFAAIDGLHEAVISGAEGQFFVKLKMQDVKSSDGLKQSDGPVYILNTGSPHYVKFVSEEVNGFPLVEESRKIRYNDEFKAKGINVNFANSNSIDSIRIRTYERGVEDETLSCGTGVTAAAIGNILLHNPPSGNYQINVKVNGGELSVNLSYNKDNYEFTNIWLNGPAIFVFEGEIEI